MTEVELVNRALIHLGVRARVQSLAEDSEAARHASQLFTLSRKATLRAFDWSFARKRAALTLLSDNDTDPDYQAPPADWAYVYEYPADCLAIRGFVQAQAPYFAHPGCADLLDLAPIEPPPYEVGIDESLTVKVIFTDIADAVLKYTADVVDLSLFDEEAYEAFAWRMAAELAMPLTGDTALRDKADAGFARSVSSAKASSANETVPKKDTREASWVEARE